MLYQNYIHSFCFLSNLWALKPHNSHLFCGGFNIYGIKRDDLDRTDCCLSVEYFHFHFSLWNWFSAFFFNNKFSYPAIRKGCRKYDDVVRHCHTLLTFIRFGVCARNWGLSHLLLFASHQKSKCKSFEVGNSPKSSAPKAILVIISRGRASHWNFHTGIPLYQWIWNLQFHLYVLLCIHPAPFTYCLLCSLVAV